MSGKRTPAPIIRDGRVYQVTPDVLRGPLTLTSAAARRRRRWCFLAHRWWVPTDWEPFAPTGHYLCRRCGESWRRP